MDIITGLLLSSVSLMSISLLRTYSRTPSKELRRLTRQGDETAAELLKAASYGHNLRALLWVIIAVSCSSFFIFVARNAPIPLAIAISGLLILIGFVLIPTGKVTKLGQYQARLAAPVLAKVLYYLSPFFDKLGNFIRGRRQAYFHTGLYEKADLLDLLDNQQIQTGNRIEQHELVIARHALIFGERLVRDVMTPRRMVTMAEASADLGPVLMSELHDSGHSRFPVYETKEDNIIGILFLRDLINHQSGGKVKSLIQTKPMYVHEDQTLNDVLQAILKTKQHMYVVVNSFEEYTGIITIEDVLEQIIGKLIVDEFDEYEDLRSVAAHHADKEHKKHVKQEPAEPVQDQKPLTKTP